MNEVDRWLKDATHDFDASLAQHGRVTLDGARNTVDEMSVTFRRRYDDADNPPIERVGDVGKVGDAAADEQHLRSDVNCFFRFERDARQQTLSKATCLTMSEMMVLAYSYVSVSDGSPLYSP